MLLIRPMQERSVYALAAAIEPGFWKEYKANLHKAMEERERPRANRGKAKNKSRLMIQRARRIIQRREEATQGTDEFFQGNIDFFSLTSDIQHHHSGWSQRAQMSRRDRIEVISTNPPLRGRSTRRTRLGGRGHGR